MILFPLSYQGDHVKLLLGRSGQDKDYMADNFHTAVGVTYHVTKQFSIKVSWQTVLYHLC